MSDLGIEEEKGLKGGKCACWDATKMRFSPRLQEEQGLVRRGRVRLPDHLGENMLGRVVPQS